MANVDLENDTYLTIAEVAAKLRISKMTVRRLIDQEDLQAIWIGRSVRIVERSYLAMLERSRGGVK